MSDIKRTFSERILDRAAEAGLQSDSIETLRSNLDKPVTHRQFLDTLYKQAEINALLSGALVALTVDDRDKTVSRANDALDAIKAQLDELNEVAQKAFGVAIGTETGGSDARGR